jgi:hypothetical protein
MKVQLNQTKPKYCSRKRTILAFYNFIILRRHIKSTVNYELGLIKLWYAYHQWYSSQCLVVHRLSKKEIKGLINKNKTRTYIQRTQVKILSSYRFV